MIKGSDALGNLRTYQYDANDNPSGERLDIAGSLFDSRSVSYDLDDRKQSSTDAGGNITAYQYDAAGNVTLVTNPDAYTLALSIVAALAAIGTARILACRKLPGAANA